MQRVRFLGIFFMLMMMHPFVWGQSKQAQFYEKWESQDTVGIWKLIQNWYAEEPYNPDVYVGFFNYYAIQVYDIEVRDEIQPLGDEWSCQSYKPMQDSNLHYHCEKRNFQDQQYKLANKWADKGIALFPDRLDLRMGKALLAKETAQWKVFESTLKSSIHADDSLGHEWKWMREEAVANPAQFYERSLQGLLYELFEMKDSIGYGIIETISKEWLSIDPTSYMATSNIASCEIIKENYEYAIEILKRMIKANDKDAVIYSNIAFCYVQLGQWKKAKNAYEKAIDLDASNQTYYQSQIDWIESQKD